MRRRPLRRRLRLTLQLRVEAIACRRAGRLVLDRVSFVLGAGRGARRHGPQRSRQVDPARRDRRPRPAQAGTVPRPGTGERILAECLHLVGHRDALKGVADGRGEPRCFAAACSGNRRLAPADALARVGLAGAGSLPVAYLSAGQRRRVALARLLVARRPLWLLDEPTTALDADGAGAAGRPHGRARRGRRLDRRGHARAAAAARGARAGARRRAP